MNALRRRPSAASRIVTMLAILAMLLLPAALPAAAAPGEASEQPAPFLIISIDTVNPDVVTTASSSTVTVTGSVTNVGDRIVRDVVARLEHAPAVGAAEALRTDLTGPTDQFGPVGEFVTLSDQLARGQQVPFRFSYPLRSDAEPALGVADPGVYPLLINVNGTPDYGAPARLDDARFLLPVLGVPREDSTGDTGPVGTDALEAVIPRTPASRCRRQCCGRWPTGPGWRRAYPAEPPRCG